jgi:uncharacterized protein (TIGR03437 family)
MILTLGMLNYSALPFLPTQILPTKVSAYGLSPVPEREGMVYAVTASGKLINFNFVTPSAINNTVNITGLQPGELVVGIDFRPRTGQLYGLSNASRVYTINTLTGVVTQVGTMPITPRVTGTAYSIDFNPVPDAIRIVTDDDQNLRVNPNTGVLGAVDGTLAFAPTDPNAGANPNVAGAAYTNGFSGATSTSLYGIDSNLNILVRQGSEGGTPTSPNTGQLVTVGPLGVDTDDQVGLDTFDIVPPRMADQVAPGDAALASLTSPGATTSSLFWIDLPTGTATLISQIGGGETIRDIAIVQRVETIFALTPSNRLISFNSGTPGTLSSMIGIKGLSPSETLVGLDFRPATGELYSIGSSGLVYTINTSTGMATPVNVSAVPAVNGNPPIGFDFNPAADLLRVVNGNEQNFRINPNNIAVVATPTPDGNLAFATGDPNEGADPNVVASAYVNNFAGANLAGGTALYGIDSTLNALVTQGTALGVTPSVNPNTGQLFTVATLSMGAGGPMLEVGDDTSFDIASETNAAFVSYTPAGLTSSTLGTLNLSTGAVTPIGTIGGGEAISAIAIGVRVEKVFALTSSNSLISFNSRTPTPDRIMRTVPVSGLQSGETLVGIDFRPATGQLYGIGNAGRIYTIDTTLGVAMQVGTAPTTALNGTSFGFDFNPAADRIRVTSDQGQNLRYNPITGALVTPDGNLIYGPGDNFAGQTPVGVAAAYTNSFAGTTSTTLFLIDPSKNTLARQGSAGGAPISPNGGQVSTIGPLGLVINTSNPVGFDVSDDGNAYASFTSQGSTQSQLFRINLRTGAASAVNPMGMGMGGVVTDIAVQTNFTPSAVDPGFVVTNSASFLAGAVAPDSLVSLFGSFQTQNGQSFVASGTPGPALGGISVTFNGTSSANLYYTSPGQINITVPSDVVDGPSLVQVTNANMSTRAVMVTVVRAAPGIFTANGSGTGTAFGYTTFDGITYFGLLNADGTERPAPVADASGRPNIIAILTTGVGNATAANPNDGNGVAEAVTALVQGISVPVVFAGKTTIPGFDQINITIPPSVAQLIPATGQLQVTLQFSVGGLPSNIVTFTIAPQIGSTPPAPAAPRVGLSQTIIESKTATDQLQFKLDDTKGMTRNVQAPLLSEEQTKEYAKRIKSERPR